MARPHGADPEATKRRVLNAASDLFARFGEGNVSVRKIAVAADISVATVNLYFGSKKGLYQQCVAEAYRGLDDLDPFQALIAEADLTSASFIQRCIETIYLYIRENPNASRLMMRQVLDEGEIEDHSWVTHAGPLLGEGMQLLQSQLTLSVEEARLRLQTFAHSLVRYAVSNHDHLRNILNRSNLSNEAVDAFIVTHLCQLAALLFLQDTPFEFENIVSMKGEHA
jgi:AcrR family transcriptional regulator